MADDQQCKLQQIRALDQELIELKRSLLASPSGLSELSSSLDTLVLQVYDVAVALPVEQVEEVTPMVLVSPLPRAPTAVRGTINYRGRIVPVLDLKYSLSGVLSPLDPDMFLVFTSSDGNLFSLVVDQVEGVQRFDLEDVDSTPMVSSMPGFVHCLLRSKQDPVILLEPTGVLTAGELDLLRDLLAEVNETREGAAG